MKLNLIFAITPEKLFGINNHLPWDKCKEDMDNFKSITTDIFNNSYIVMGRKTFESLPNKLTDRINVVISKTLKITNEVISKTLEGCNVVISKTLEGCNVVISKTLENKYDLLFNSFDEFIKSIPYDNNAKIFVIGGKSLIEECLSKYKNIIDNIYISIINKEVIDGINKVYLDINLDNYKPYLKNICYKKEVTIYHYKIQEHQELQYLNLLKKTMIGHHRQTRNAKTFSIFSENLSFDLTKGFPLLTTKKVFLRGIFEELLFFICGQTNSKLLENKCVNIWKPNTTKEFINKCGLPYEEGDMGPLYGFNWKHFGAEYTGCASDYTGKGYNQLEYVLYLLENDSSSRRILLTDYNPSIANQGVLYPCHSIIIQFYVSEVGINKMVSMNMYQRSVDEFLGLPFNIASNALFLHLICNTLNVRTKTNNYYPDKLNILMGDCHIYETHLDAVKEQLQRVPNDLPQIQIKNSYYSLEKYKWEDIEILNYNCYSSIKAEMIV
jgi:thymidylate synthase/dihydrofolate reductase